MKRKDYHLRLLLPGALLGIIIALTPGSHAEDLYYHLPLASFVSRDKLASKPGQDLGEYSKDATGIRAFVDSEGEVYFDFSQSDKGGMETFLAVRAPAEKAVTCRIYPISSAVPIRFTIAADKATPQAKSQFYAARETHYAALLDREIPGAAWFRHQEKESARAAGQGESNRPQRMPFRSRPDLLNGDQTLDLFSGGRAVSENLQLDRLLRATQAGNCSVDINSIQGITVRAMDWSVLLGGAKPLLDTLALYVPGDQHAIFFPSFNALIAVMNEAEADVTPFLNLLEPRSEDAITRDRYHRQLCLELSDVSRTFGPQLISSVALTGSDPYLVSGSDIAVLFETKSPNIIRTFVSARQTAIKQTNSAVRAVEGEIEGVGYSGVVSADRSVSSYVAALENAVLVSNSPYKLGVLIKTAKGKTNSLELQPEYLFFRSRYPKADRDEAAFLILTDATIRRWCGPRWRIGNSRRVRAAAALSELQAAHLDEIAKGDQASCILQSELAGPDLGEVGFNAGGVSSRAYGALDFLTPIAELPLDKVTCEERDAYNAWRNGYQNNWRQFFDPIALRLSINSRQLSGEVTVMPLITSSDYNDFFELTRGARIAPGAGDRHLESIMHFTMAINPESRLMHEASGLINSPDSPIRVNPLGWLGSSISLYADRDPFWERLLKAGKPGEFLGSNYYTLPIALQCEVKNLLGVSAFLAGLRSRLDTATPQMLLWQSLDYNGHAYVRVAPSKSFNSADFANLAIYYAVTPGSLTITENEALLKRALDRQSARSSKKSDGLQETSDKSWLGTNLCLQVDQNFLVALEKMSLGTERTSPQRISWNNLLILNEWKRLYPSQDPVKFHERYWKTRLVCPGGGAYVWNEKWQTMESTAYGHPGDPKEPTTPHSRLGKFSNVNLGLTFENQGLSAKGVFGREPSQ